ncbi:MAG: AAC(3) family N-acetyltransferase [Deltaproteobacteria bacterium]|nr:AAC(3) family N-acetyltransferase [Deltaproteobacteria bacterium]
MTRETTKGPSITEQRLRSDLEGLGVKEGDMLVVHSSLSSLGWVLGGAPTVVRAVLGALGSTGTLVMPAATPQCGEPTMGPDRSADESHLGEVRDHLPVFDPQTTPTSLGAIPETFRTWPGTLRSHHPLESICARGPIAQRIVRDHPLAFSEGPGSPFDKLYQSGARVLLLGVGFNRCTALHFAESLVARRRTMKIGFHVMEPGGRTWVEVANVADDNDTHFPVVGDRYLEQGEAVVGSVGSAQAILFSMTSLVDFARDYFDKVL